MRVSLSARAEIFEQRHHTPLVGIFKLFFAHTLYLLVSNFRAELPVTDYKTAGGSYMMNERADFEISRDALMKMSETPDSEMRFGLTEFMFPAEARALMHDFVKQIEQSSPAATPKP